VPRFILLDNKGTLVQLTFISSDSHCCTYDLNWRSIYSRLSVKKTKDKSFKDQAILIAESFSGNYMDGKKIIVQVIDDKPFIIDMANYYEF
jgi:hypothetical protein